MSNQQKWILNQNSIIEIYENVVLISQFVSLKYTSFFKVMKIYAFKPNESVPGLFATMNILKSLHNRVCIKLFVYISKVDKIINPLFVKNRFSLKTDSRWEKKSSWNNILFKIVSENRFSGKTYFYTIASSSPSEGRGGSSGGRGIWRGARTSSGRYDAWVCQIHPLWFITHTL